MNRPNQSGKYPPWGCLGWVCWCLWFVFLTLLLASCLQIEGSKNEKLAEALALGVLVFSLVSFYFVWPALVAAASGGKPSSDTREEEESPHSETSFPSDGTSRSKSDEEFPWEVFAYGYLMHELLDDDPPGEGSHQADETWEADAGGDADYGEEYWGDDLFDS